MGIGNYRGVKTVEFSIVAADLSSAEVASVADQAYTGAPVEPELSVKLGSVELKAGIDYRVSYENNVQVGRASFTVTGQGNYTGSVSGGFAIVKVETEWKRIAGDDALDDRDRKSVV